MENLLDMLIPIIIVVGWVLKGIFSGNGEDEGSSQPRPRSKSDESYPDTEYESRQRRIQEEIRRKIMERRQAAEGGGEVPTPSQQQRPVVMSADHAEAKRRRVQERLKQRAEKHKEVAERVHETEPEAADPTGFSWEESNHDYEHALEAQRARIEETKRQAARLQSQLSSQSKQASSSTGARRQRSSYRGPIRVKLRDPAAARDAIIYSEVLGKPVGMREG